MFNFLMETSLVCFRFNAVNFFAILEHLVEIGLLKLRLLLIVTPSNSTYCFSYVLASPPQPSTLTEMCSYFVHISVNGIFIHKVTNNLYLNHKMAIADS